MSAPRRSAAPRSPQWLPTLLLSGLFAVGCERKALPPAACQRFAAIAVGLEHAEQLRVPLLRAAFDDRVRACLTTPYDASVLRCAEQTGDGDGCVMLWHRRRAMERAGPRTRSR